MDTHVVFLQGICFGVEKMVLWTALSFCFISARVVFVPVTTARARGKSDVPRDAHLRQVRPLPMHLAYLDALVAKVVFLSLE